VTAPQIDHRPSIEDDRNCGAKLAALFEIFRKRFPDVLEALVAITFDFEV